MGTEKLINSKNNTVDELIKKVNEIVSKNINILKGKDDIEKWNTIPRLLLLKDSEQKQLLLLAQFLDTLLITQAEKAMHIISLSALIQYGNLKLQDYDDILNLFMIVSYYQNCSIDDINETLPIVGNKELIAVIREKTLDIEVRKKLLLDIANRAINDKIDITNKKEVATFTATAVQEIKEKDYYDLVK